jgi:hypothetical protein
MIVRSRVLMSLWRSCGSAYVRTRQFHQQMRHATIASVSTPPTPVIRYLRMSYYTLSLHPRHLFLSTAPARIFDDDNYTFFLFLHFRFALTCVSVMTICIGLKRTCPAFLRVFRCAIGLFRFVSANLYPRSQSHRHAVTLVLAAAGP